MAGIYYYRRQFWISKVSRRIVERCKSCASEKAIKNKNYGVNFFSNSLGSARKRAATKSLPFDIDAEYLRSIFQKDKKCPIFGTPMEAGVRGNMNDSPSLDKIVPTKGYVKDNVWYISMRANKIKSDHSLNDILLTAYGILAKQRELGIENDVDVQLEKQLRIFANRLKRKE